MSTSDESSTDSSWKPEATTSKYIITTKTGTDLSTFQSYIKTLPDRGEGYQIVFPNVPWQSYITDLTTDQAKEARKLPFVLVVSLNYESTIDSF